MATTTAISSISYETREVDEGESALILDGYSLLSEVMDGGSVEDRDEFLKSVSPSPDGAVLPKMVLASDRGAMIGFSVGMCLTEIRSGFIAYSAVRPGWRRRGVYKGMRCLLVSAMRKEARQTCGRLDYIFSELERSSPLLPWYLDKLRASVATCRYEQAGCPGASPQTAGSWLCSRWIDSLPLLGKSWCILWEGYSSACTAYAGLKPIPPSAG